MVMQGRDKGLWEGCRNRGSLCDGNNAWSSLHPSMIALGCLDEGDKRGEGQGHYLSRLGFRARYRYCNKVESR